MAVRIGFKDLYYALLEEDTAAAIEYAAPVKIAKAISGTVTPTVNSATLFADDGPAESAESLGGIAVEFVVDDFALEVQAALLGKQLTNGILVDSNEDSAPYVAVGFRSRKSNGKDRFVWLLKGKFSLPTDSYQTKGDTPTFQTPTIAANFVVRDHDGLWRLTGDEDATGFTAAATWFTSVPTAPTAPEEPGGA